MKKKRRKGDGRGELSQPDGDLTPITREWGTNRTESLRLDEHEVPSGERGGRLLRREPALLPKAAARLSRMRSESRRPRPGARPVALVPGLLRKGGLS